MILSIKDRLILPGIFAANKDTLIEATVQRSIRLEIGIAAEEAAAIDLKEVNAGFIWDPAKALDKKVEFSATQISYLKESIYTFSRHPDHHVSQELLPIVEKINSFVL